MSDLEGEFDYGPITDANDHNSLVAIMLGHLRMNIEGAIHALIAVATAIFPEGSRDAVDPEENLKRLKEAIEDMLQTNLVPVNTKMRERSRPPTRCKV